MGRQAGGEETPRGCPPDSCQLDPRGPSAQAASRLPTSANLEKGTAGGRREVGRTYLGGGQLQERREQQAAQQGAHGAHRGHGPGAPASP